VGARRMADSGHKRAREGGGGAGAAPPSWRRRQQQQEEEEEEGEVSRARGPDSRPSWKVQEEQEAREEKQRREEVAAAEGKDVNGGGAPQAMTLTERLMAEAASFQASVAGEGAEPATGGAATSGGDHATDGEARSSSARSSHGVQGQAEGDGPGPGGRELGCESGAPAAGAGVGGEHTGRAGLDSISCRTVDNYEKDKKMGEGQYGAVYRAKDRCERCQLCWARVLRLLLPTNRWCACGM
jgi:hypothetical protein